MHSQITQSYFAHCHCSDSRTNEFAQLLSSIPAQWLYVIIGDSATWTPSAISLAKAELQRRLNRPAH